MRVLVVDDEAGIRHLIGNVLTIKGYEILEAENGLEALELALQYPCDLVITDQVMPGMSGLDLIARLRAQAYPARYLLISGFGLESGESPGVPFLGKPFTMPQLLETLAELAHKPALPELERAWRKAWAEWREAIRDMDMVISDLPSGIPLPDGTLAIQQAGNKRKDAYKKCQAALRCYKQALKEEGPPGRAEPQSRKDADCKAEKSHKSAEKAENAERRSSTDRQ